MRILLADRHGTTLRAVAAVVQTRPSWSVCGIATSAEEAVACTDFLAPDVVLLDIGLPGRPTVEVVPELQRLAPSTSVIVLSPYDSERLASEFTRCGVASYLLKRDIGVRLTNAIEGRFAPAGNAADAPVARDPQVTAREREVLALLATGRRNREVAQTLGISSKTVETHRARIMSKLDLHSMSALVRYAIRHQLIEA